MMAAKGDAYILHLAKRLEAPIAALATDARFLDAPEGLAQVAHVLAVDEYHPSLDAGRETMRLADILRPHVRRKPVLDLIRELESFRFILKRDQARDRSEDFLLRDAHSVVDVGKHRGPQEMAIPHP